MLQKYNINSIVDQALILIEEVGEVLDQVQKNLPDSQQSTRKLILTFFDGSLSHYMSKTYMFFYPLLHTTKQ